MALISRLGVGRQHDDMDVLIVAGDGPHLGKDLFPLGVVAGASARQYPAGSAEGLDKPIGADHALRVLETIEP